MTSDRSRNTYVYVVLPGDTEFTTAGRFRLRRGPGGKSTGEFVYGRSYLDRADAVELDPVELRLADRLYQTGRMDGFFGTVRDAMPDYWGRLLIERRLGRSPLDEFEYLMAAPDDRAGALGFGPTVTPPPPRLQFSGTVQLVQLQLAADAVEAGEAVESGRAVEPVEAGDAGDTVDISDLVEAVFEEGTSMGGARPKAVVVDDDALWLAKFSRPRDRWNDPRVEHALLLLARECGIRAAESRIERVGTRDVLLVRRFDRERAEDGVGWLRHRMTSALTLLRSDDSPTGRERWSYLALADEVRRASARPRDDLHELFVRMCFNAAVSNQDDHPRNHAIVARRGPWRLAPAYDLTPSPSRSMSHAMERDLSMVCGPTGRRARRVNLVAGAGRFLMSREDAEATFDHVCDVVRSRWQETMRRAGVGVADQETVRSAFVPEGLFSRDGSEAVVDGSAAARARRAEFHGLWFVAASREAP